MEEIKLMVTVTLATKLSWKVQYFEPNSLTLQFTVLWKWFLK